MKKEQQQMFTLRTKGVNKRRGVAAATDADRDVLIKSEARGIYARIFEILPRNLPSATAAKSK